MDIELLKRTTVEIIQLLKRYPSEYLHLLTVHERNSFLLAWKSLSVIEHQQGEEKLLIGIYDLIISYPAFKAEFFGYGDEISSESGIKFDPNDAVISDSNSWDKSISIPNEVITIAEIFAVVSIQSNDHS